MAARSVIHIERDAEAAVAYVKERLGAISDSRARMAVRTAINRTAREVKKTDERAAKRTFTDKGDLNALTVEKATTANLEAVLRDRGGSVSLHHFKVRHGVTVVSALINKNRGYKQITKYGNKVFINDAFVPGVVFVRKTKNRLPIEGVKSLSSPSAHGAPDVWEKETRGRGEQVFAQYLETEILKLMGI